MIGAIADAAPQGGEAAVDRGLVGRTPREIRKVKTGKESERSPALHIF
jgi:hypothetical protein